MKTEKKIQEALLSQMRQKLTKSENLTKVLMDVLELSQDAVYRRIRLETYFTLQDLQRISHHFGISIDSVLSKNENAVYFKYNPTSSVSIDNYLSFIHDQFTFVKKLNNPQITLTVNNTPFLHLFSFPNLLRFKLFFWMKYQLENEDFQSVNWNEFSFNEKQLELIESITNMYASIPTTEFYDSTTLRGLIREMEFYSASNEITNMSQLVEELQQLFEYLCKQLESGHKINNKGHKTTIEAYYNEVLNASALFYYSSNDQEGIYLAQNFLNPILISDPTYLTDTKVMLANMMAHSIQISKTGLKQRNVFFSGLKEYLSERLNG